VAAIVNMRAPATVPELRSVLGYWNYYKGYLPRFATVSRPLFELLRKDVKGFPWGLEQHRALDMLKREMATPGLVLRTPDPNLPYLLHTDWSSYGIGAVLGQVDVAHGEYMVCCISRSLNKHERQYSSFQGELLACVWAVKTLRHYLCGHPFTIVTDHQPLTWLLSAPVLAGQSARWAMSLQDHEFTVQHRAGVKHQNADVPSRFPLAGSEDPTGACLDPEGLAACLADLSSSAFDDLVDAFLQGASALERPESLWADGLVACGDDVLSEESVVAVGASDVYGVPEVVEAREALRLQANEWVQMAREELLYCVPGPVAAVQVSEELDQRGLPKVVEHLGTCPVGAALCDVVEDGEGVLLLELFGGICAGLEAALRNGMRVARYVYCDADPLAQRFCAHRVRVLQYWYPDLLPC